MGHGRARMTPAGDCAVQVSLQFDLWLRDPTVLAADGRASPFGCNWPNADKQQALTRIPMLWRRATLIADCVRANRKAKAI